MRALALVLACLATPLHALSCMAPDPFASFDRAAASEEVYTVVVGELAFDPGLLPTREGAVAQGIAEDVTRIPARLTGNGLSRKGFVVPVDRVVDLAVSCLGPWCGGIAPGVEHLLFIEHVGDGNVISVGPCGGDAFPRPDRRTLEGIEACMATERCTGIR